MEPRIPNCNFRLGACDAEALQQSERSGTPLPALHSSRYAPVAGATTPTGVTAMPAAVIDLLGQGRGR